MKAWLKGGLIGGGIILFLYLIALPLKGSVIVVPFYCLSYPLFLIFYFVFGNKANGVISYPGGEFFSFPKGWFVFLTIILYFLIGSLIGWIVGKMKSHA